MITNRILLIINVLCQTSDKSAQRYIKVFKDADIIQYDGHDQYTNPNAKNPQ